MNGVSNSFDIVNDEDVVFTGSNYGSYLSDSTGYVNFRNLFISYYSSDGDSLWTENFGDSSGYSYGTSILSIDTEPLDGYSKPAKILNNVVLPHPEGPKREKKSPLAILISTLSTAITSSKFFDKFFFGYFN